MRGAEMKTVGVWLLLSHFSTFDVVLNTYESWGQCQVERVRVIKEALITAASITCIPERSAK